MRTITVLIATLAAAANSLAAMGSVCCCRPALGAVCSCCSLPEKPAVDATLKQTDGCCSQPAAGKAELQTAPGKCQCGQPPAASIMGRETDPQAAPDAALQSPCAGLDGSALAPTHGRLCHALDKFAISGPALLALYCTWLK